MMCRGQRIGTILILTLITWTINNSAVDGSKTSCSICGQRCLDACGTEAFRPCCLSYNRKRASLGSDSTTELGITAASEEATSHSGARQRTIDLMKQLYASALDGVIGHKSASRMSHVHKKTTTGNTGQQWKIGSDNGPSDLADFYI